MLGEEKIRGILDRALACSTADQAEVILIGRDSALTRFANSAIHQNMAERDTQLRVRAVVGKRIGVASTNNLSQESLERTTDKALTVAKLQPPNPDFVSLPGPVPIPEVESFDEATAACTSKQRAKAVELICRQAVENGLIASGALETGVYELAVANSLGVFTYYLGTSAELSTVIMSETSSGYATSTSWRMEEIDAIALGQEAIGKALRGREPREIELGRYTVILEEYAVQDVLEMLAYLGFGAQAVQEERSFMCGRFGERIADERVSIWDDGLDPKGLPTPFDFEGVPKKKVELIRDGVAKGVVYDSYTAGKEGKDSTGHALPAPNTFGPLPTNLFMASGEATLEEMLASTKRGILVTRFWYTRPVHPKLTIVTGMTRDGTFLIKGGEVAYPIKNMRFTQSYLECLTGVEMIGRRTKLVKGMKGIGVSRVPALKIGEFEFTGVTEF